jgi:hypothetical protein
MAAIGMNHAAAQMDFATGIPNFTPRMQVPDIPRGPPILNHIKIDNSTVGVINTGKAQAIDVNISVLSQAGSADLSNALKGLTEAIMNDRALAELPRADMLDQVGFLSDQAAAAAPQRKPGMIRAAFAALNDATGAVTSVSTAWNAAEPLLRSIFGL